MLDNTDLDNRTEPVRETAQSVSDAKMHRLPSAVDLGAFDEAAMRQESDPFARKLNSPLQRFFERVVILFQVHLAIIVGTVAGLVVFGLVPSYLSAVELLDETLYGHEAHLFTRFFNLWKMHFRASLKWTAIILLGAAGCFGLWYLLWYVQHPVLSIVANLLFFLILLSLSLIIFYYPVLRLYYPHMSEGRLCGFAVLFSYGHFATSLLLMLVTTATVLFFLFIPQFAVFICLAVLPWASLVLCRRLLPKGIIRRRASERYTI